MQEVWVPFLEDVEGKGEYLLITEQLLSKVHWRAGRKGGAVH